MQTKEQNKTWFLITRDQRKVSVLSSKDEVDTFLKKNKRLGKFEVHTQTFPSGEVVTLDSFRLHKNPAKTN